MGIVRLMCLYGIAIFGPLAYFETVFHGWWFAFLFLVPVRCIIGMWRGA